MTVIVRGLLDPELVIPSDQHAARLTFWARLDQWTKGEVPYIGPETLRAVGELLANPPAVPGLAAYDLRRIAGRVASRVLPPADPRESCCEAHVLSRYSSAWGDVDNRVRLEIDVASFPVEYALVLATDSAVWQSGLPDQVPTCESCESRRIHFQLLPGTSPSSAWRDELSRSGLSVENLERYSSELFPSLVFAAGAWSHAAHAISGERGPEDLLHHLAVLNDHAAEIWSHHVDTRMREQQLASRGLVASPESPNTRRNAAAIAARTFTFAEGDVSCQWHTKLSPTSGRIHFEVDGERVLIGAIVEHLPT